MSEHDFDSCTTPYGQCAACDEYVDRLTGGRPIREWDVETVIRVLARARPDKWGDKQ